MKSRIPPSPEDSPVQKILALHDDLEEEADAMPKKQQSEHQELVLLRTKLEVRTWFLRVSLMFNMGVVTGIIVAILNALKIF